MKRLTHDNCLAGIFAFLTVSGAMGGGGSISDPDGIMNFQIHYRYVPTQSQIDALKEETRIAADKICDATDGQIRFGEVRITGGAASEAAGDIWLLPEPGRSFSPAATDGSSLGRAGAHIHLFSNSVRGNTIAHELGHLAFGLGDEYYEAERCIGKNFKFVDDPADLSFRQDNAGNSSIMQFSGQSEFSVDANHDLNRGQSPYYMCGRIRPDGAGYLLRATLDPDVAIGSFDNSSFASARSSSSLVVRFNLFAGILHPAWIFFTRIGAQRWHVEFAMDDGDFVGGTDGDYRALGSAAIEMGATADGFGRFPLLSATPPDFTLEVADLAVGVADLSRPVNFGTVGSTDGVHENPAICIDDGAGGCIPTWDPVLERYEMTQQTARQRRSDWATLVANYPFVVPPVGTPEETPPTNCRDALVFDERIVGSDQVILIVDRSGSMTAPVSAGAATTRLDFARAAARAFIDLQADSGVDVGMISFNEGTTLERPMELLEDADAGPFKDRVDLIEAGGYTGIGTALQSSVTEFQRAALVAEAAGLPVRSRTAFLLSDGQNNRGEDPETVADRLRATGVQVFSIPVGSGADRSLLDGLAASSGGDVMNAPAGDELPPIYAELFARYRGESLVLGRRASMVEPLGDLKAFDAGREQAARPGESPQAGGDATSLTNPFVDSFDFAVEADAERLNIFLSGRNPDMESWDVNFRITSPGGTLYTRADDDVVFSDPFYTIVRLPNPEPGTWRVDLASGNNQAQSSFLQAHVENFAPDLFVDAKPDVVTDTTIASGISIEASYLSALDSNVEYAGFVRRPDGSTVALNFDLDIHTEAVTATFARYAGRGVYEVIVTANVGETVRRRAGETIFPGDDVDLDLVEPFTRTAGASFFVDIAELPPCRISDCDGDGIPNQVEGGDDVDTDGDGLPDYRDDDADADDLPDAIEGTRDSDLDGRPDFQDVDSDNDGIPDGMDERLWGVDAWRNSFLAAVIVVAVLLALILVVLLRCCCCRRK